MTRPKLTNLGNKAEQIITLFSKELWDTVKRTFHPNIQNLFSAKKGEFFILANDNAVNFMIGLGENPKANEIQKTAERFAHILKHQIQAMPTLLQAEGLSEDSVNSFITGLFLGTYHYPFDESHPFWNGNFELQNPHFNDSDRENLANKIYALCKGQFTAMDWLNKPANFKKTPQISEFLKQISEDYNLIFSTFNRKECVELGLNAFVSVNLGSAEDCAFTVLEYDCGIPDAKTVGLIGKCVLFDTGGISLKNPENMHYMKSDMGGATAVIGTLTAVCEQKLPINIIAILPVTDNAISATATLPGDVVTAYNGRTIEVLNTDAEGRMTLADALSYLATNYKTDALIDLATLTGSAVRMFGDTCGAMFSNNETLKNQLIKSGDETSQRLWNLPLWDIWKDDFKSDVADFKNISMKPIGDCIVAGKFLEQFTEGHPNWAHLDIAGVAFCNTFYSKEKAATGYGVQLLLKFLEEFLN